MLADFDPLLDRASYATYFISALNQNLFEHVGHHQVVFGNYNLEHPALPFSGVITAFLRRINGWRAIPAP
jgi:hypothetical protein